MEYIIMWLGTIAVSTGMKTAAALKLVKNLADCGYKLDIDRLQEVSKYINPMDERLQKIINLIPVCNLFFALYIVVGTSIQREKIMDAMKVMGALEYMTDEEQEAYDKNRSGMNAVKIMAMSKQTKDMKDNMCTSNDKDIIITNTTDDDMFVAIIAYSNDSKDFVIKGVRGTIENLSYDKQKEKIRLVLEATANNENEINERKENWENVSKKISEYEETKENDEKSIKEKWQELRQEISQYTAENKDSKDKQYNKNKKKM